jgi:hypothetical protein
MNNDQEKQLQENLFNRRKSGKDIVDPLGVEDSRLYQLIFDALEEMPELDIPVDFAEKSAQKAIKRKWLLDLGRQLMLYIGFAGVFLATSSIFLLFFGHKILNDIQVLFVQYRWPLLFCVFIFLIIQLTDNIILKGKTQSM